MKKVIRTSYTDQEFRQLIRDEIKNVLSGEDMNIAGSNDEGFITLVQASEFLKLKPNSIYNRIHQKTIPFHKSGKRVLFKKSELADWIKK